MKRRLIENGSVFGDLTVIREEARKKYAHGGVSRVFLCRCSCGNYVKVLLGHLIDGHTTSCGCKRTRHGDCHTDLYHKWIGMLSRCKEVTGDHAKYYFDHGIRVCEEWATDYVSFRKWSLANGYTKGMSLDRIDNDRGYEPDNCRWVTMKDQGRNKRNNRLITIDGETRPMSFWCEVYNTYPQLVGGRLSRGWPVKEAFLGRSI